MNRKFECWECRHIFVADDSSWVQCPKCESDNVEYASFHLPKQTKKVCLAAVATTVVVGGGLFLFDAINTPQKEVSNKVMEDSHFTEKADSNFIASGGTIAPSLSISEIEYDEEKGTYHCKFDVAYPPKESWKIIIMSYYGNKEIASSDNGVFEDLPFSEDDGFYRVKLVDASSGNLLCEERDFPNFEKQVTIKKPMDAATLQTLLNGKKTLVDNPYIAHDHKVVVTNKPAGDTSETGSLGQVQDLLQMCKLTAVVTSVEHDNLNKISSVVIKINYPDDWIEDEEY